MTQQTQALPNRSWRGYTLDELRTRQAITDTHIIAHRITLARQIQTIRDSRSLPNRSMLKKMINALGYVDYAVLGVMLSRRLTSIIAKLRRQKASPHINSGLRPE